MSNTVDLQHLSPYICVFVKSKMYYEEKYFC